MDCNHLNIEACRVVQVFDKYIRKSGCIYFFGYRRTIVTNRKLRNKVRWISLQVKRHVRPLFGKTCTRVNDRPNYGPVRAKGKRKAPR